LLFCIIFNFYAGKFLVIENLKNHHKKIFISSIILNLSILIFFKYIIFFSQTANDLFTILKMEKRIPVLDILLPVGISFYTFHNISYLSDIYKKKIQPTQSIISFSIYDLFFPLLLSGPIERAEKLLPQIENERVIHSENFQSGFLLFCYGIFKKVFISDNIASFVNMGLEPTRVIPDGLVYYLAFAFAFQVYSDFSGYTDSARGLARMMGFELSLNFNLPFISKNPVEFWTRWHISLSTWLRDYVYIPLGGNRNGFIKQNLNIMIVWLLGGLWHGATYGYLIWGLYCGFQIVFYNLWVKIKDSFSLNLDFKFFNYFSVLLTFFLFGFGLLLFRVENKDHLLRLWNNASLFYWNINLILKLIFFISPILIIESIQIIKKDLNIFQTKNLNLKFYFLSFLFCIQFLLFSSFEAKEFFYFQF
jgi:D-alanyl-lipoteichoic acid acyltransferase DltB (MBOAT superfamily)